MKYFFIVLALTLSSCTYNISQQQIQSGRRPSAQAVGISNNGVSAGQTSGAPVVAPPPPSTYPEYNGYPGSGYQGYQSSASSFFRGLFEGVVQINVGPGYGTDYNPYVGGYVGPPGCEYHGPYYGPSSGPHRLLYPYYH